MQKSSVVVRPFAPALALTWTLLWAAVLPGQSTPDLPPDPAKLYETHCSACHGVNMEGAQYTPLKKDRWIYAADKRGVLRIIMYGIEGTDMAPFESRLSQAETEALVDYIFAGQELTPDEVRSLPPTIQTKDYLVHVEALVSEGFRSSPWGIEFLDEHRALITERRGGLRLMVDGQLNPAPIGGLPTPTQYGDSGMYDLALDPDYAENGWIYIAYVHALGDPSTRDTPAMTRVIRGRIREHQWVDQETIFQLPDELHFARGSRWGSRLLFDTEGRLYFSIGDIGRNDDVQELGKPAGKVFRIRSDGSIAEDNPYAESSEALPAIFSVGNRNVQGIDQHPETGDIWASEHGPMGGDEVNILQRGANYGWPTITYGLNYDGTIVSDLTRKDGMEQPVKYWTPSPGLSALVFYTGDHFPKWKNRALVGAMRFEEIKILEIEGSQVLSEEILLKGYGRVRDIQQGPDGAIYVLLNNPHKVVRLSN